MLKEMGAAWRTARTRGWPVVGMLLAIGVVLIVVGGLVAGGTVFRAQFFDPNSAAPGHPTVTSNIAGDLIAALAVPPAFFGLALGCAQIADVIRRRWRARGS